MHTRSPSADKLARALAAAHRQRGICAGSAARALPERGQRPVLAPPEHWQLATKTEFAECVHRADTRRSPSCWAGGHGDPDCHRLQPARLPRLHRAGARRGFLLQCVSLCLKGASLKRQGRPDLPGRSVTRTTMCSPAVLRPVHSLKIFASRGTEARRPNERPGGETFCWHRHGAHTLAKASCCWRGAGVGSAACVLPPFLQAGMCSGQEGIFQVRPVHWASPSRCSGIPRRKSWRKERKRRKASSAQKPKKEAPPHQKAKLTLDRLHHLKRGGKAHLGHHRPALHPDRCCPRCPERRPLPRLLGEAMAG